MNPQFTHTMRCICMFPDCAAELEPVKCTPEQANTITHGLCPACLVKHFPEEAPAVLAQLNEQSKTKAA